MTKRTWGTLLAATVLAALAAVPASAADDPVGPDLCAYQAHQAGFQEDALVQAIAVGIVESGCRPDATHRDPENGQLDQGIWQITNLQGDVEPCLMNPACNAQETAKAYTAQGDSWLPKWKASFGTQRYFDALPAARAAAEPYRIVTVGRVGVLRSGNLEVKDGNLGSNWVPQGEHIAKFEIDGNRIGVLTTGGDVLVKEGNLYADWVLQERNLTDFHISGNRIGIRRSNGVLSVKEGSLYAFWNDLIGDVKDFGLTPNRVGVVQTGERAEALVKEGGLGADWISQMNGVADIELAGNRIALLRNNKSLTVKEGSLWANWYEQIGDVTDYDVTQERVGVVQGSAGLAKVKDGGLGATWVDQMSGIKEIDLSGNWISLNRNNKQLAVKEGTLYATWTEQMPHVDQADITHYRRGTA